MRKFIAISFIFIFIFNLGGYRLWSDYLQVKADSALETSLNQSEYNEQDLVQITIPLLDAYQNDWSDYRRVDGEISFDGRIYKYVKEKVQGGQLILLCLPDHDKMRYETTKNDILKGTIDLVNTKKQHNSKLSVKNITSEYTELSLFAFNVAHTKYDGPVYYHPSQYLNSNFHLSPEQPPDFMIV